MSVQSERTRRLIHGFWYVFLVLVGLTMIIPFLWMVSASFKPQAVMKVHDSTYRNWMPGEDVTWVELGGEQVRVKKLGMKGARLGVRVVQKGPRDGMKVKLPPGDVVEEDVYFARAATGEWRTSAKEAVRVRLFRTRSAAGEPVTLSGHALTDESFLAAFLEEPGGWTRVQEQRRDTFSIEWQLIDRHPRFGEEILLPPEEVHEEWREKIALSNYTKAWNAVSLGRGYLNSIVIALIVTLGQVFTSSLAAYAFARLNFRGRDMLFFGYLATMMIPGAVTMIPVYILFAKGPATLDALMSTNVFTADLYLFKWLQIGKPLGIDSYMALMLPGLFSAYGTFMLRQFFMSIPKELEDAARIDGCSTFGIYWNVILPLSKPALATLAIFTFIGNWKSFMWPLIVCQSSSLRTLPVMLSYFQGEYYTEYQLLMAGSMMALLPVIVIFILGQRYFVSGIRLGALKG